MTTKPYVLVKPHDLTEIAQVDGRWYAFRGSLPRKRIPASFAKWVETVTDYSVKAWHDTPAPRHGGKLFVGCSHLF